MELLLRMPGSSAERSPFEAALRRVASGGRLDLAAPYLSVALLRELTASTTAFRLVTDVEEWLRAFARPARREILSFIAEHSDRVRHYRDLHAKVALSHTLAMLGSANLTDMGLHRRQEVGALVSDPAHVSALRRWFDAVWESAVSIDPSALVPFMDALAAEGSEWSSVGRVLPPPKLPDGTGERLSDDPPPTPSGEPSFTEEEDRLIDRLGTGISEEWVHLYLDSLARLHRALDLRADDPRVLTPIPKTSIALTVTFNTRGVLYRAGFVSGDFASPGAAIIQSDLSLVERSPIRAKVVGTHSYR